MENVSWYEKRSSRVKFAAPEIFHFDDDIKEIEEKMMILKRTNEMFRSRIRKVSARFEQLNRRFTKKSAASKGKINKTQVVPTPPPPASLSTILSAKIVQKSCNEMLQKILDPSISTLSTKPEKAEANYLSKKSSAVTEYLNSCYGDRPRTRSFSECRTRIDSTSFPSLLINGTNSQYGSQRSINSILRLHESLVPRASSRSYSESSIYKASQFSVPKYDEDYVGQNRRPTSLFLASHNLYTSRAPQLQPKYIVTYKNTSNQSKSTIPNYTSQITLDQYINQAKQNSTTIPKENTLQALDSCIDLLLNLAI